MWTCQYSVNLLGEKISTTALFLLRTNKAKSYYLRQKIKQSTLYAMYRLVGLIFFFGSIHLMCFVFLSLWHLLYRPHWMCHSGTLFPWLMNFQVKTSMNSLPWALTLLHKQHIYFTVYTGSTWVDLSQGSVARKICFICPQFKCITKPCFVYAHWILHWELKPTIILCSPAELFIWVSCRVS